MSDAAGISRILTLVFTDLADSTALKTQRGDQAVGELIDRHRAHVRQLAAESGGRIIDWAGDGCFLVFDTSSAAVLFALRLQQAHGEEPDLPGVRTGIHMGEVSERPGPDGDLAHPRVEGLAVDLAARISGLARPAQVLMSSSVADSARQRVDSGAFAQPIRWRTHGRYSLKGFDEPFDIREAGLESVARFEAPVASEKATRTRPSGSNRVFIGRERELGEVQAGLDATLDGQGSLLLISGEAGVGKTRLVEEATESAASRGVRVAWGRCWEGSGAPAYWPWTQIIRTLFGDGDRQRRNSIPPEIGRLIPELSRTFALEVERKHETADPEQARFRLFDAVATTLKDSARLEPVVVVLEDLHDADQGSLQMLRFAARELKEARLLIVVTYRDLEVRRSPALMGFIADIAREGRQLALGGLNDVEVAHLVESRIGVAPDSRLVAELHQATAGNPLFVDGVARLLATEGNLREANRLFESGFKIPDDVREAIRRRLSALSGLARSLLTTAAVAGNELELRLLERVCGLSSEQLLDSMAEAAEVGVVTKSHLSRYQFSHGLFRQVLADGLTSATKIRLHQQIGIELEKLCGPDPGAQLAALAHHFREATPLGEVGRAIDYSIRAGEAAYAVFAYEEAVSQWKAALRLMAGQGPDEARRPRLLGRLALALAYVLASEEALRLASEAGDMIASSEGHDAAADFIADMALAMRANGSVRGSWTLAVQGLRYIRDRHDVIWACLTGIDLVRQEAEDPENPGTMLDSPRRQELAEVIEKILAERRPQLSLEKEVFLGQLRIFPSREAVLERAGEDPVLLLLLAGEFRRARPLLQQWALLAEEEGAIANAVRGLGTLTSCHIALGEFASAWASYRKARSLAARLTGPSPQMIVLDNARFELCLALDEDWQQLVIGDVGRDVEQAPEDNWAMAAVWLDCAQLFAHLGRSKEALALVAQAIPAVDRAPGWGENYIQMACNAASTLWRLQRQDHIDIIERNIRAKVVAPDFRHPMIDGRLSLARLCGLQGRYDEANEWFAKARAVLDEQGARPLRAIADFDQALVLLRRGGLGDREQAQRYFSAAIEQFEALGMTGWLRRAEDETQRCATPSASAQGQETRSAAPTNVFRREGEYWAIVYQGDAFRLRDTQGLRYIANLLRHPDREFHALDLVAAAAGGEADGRAGTKQGDTAGLRVGRLGGAGKILDPKAKAAYRERLQELREELENAQSNNDPGRAEKAQAEIEFLTRELASAFGLGGRDSRQGSAAERARQSVNKAIQLTLRKIAEHSVSLQRHFHSTLKTGTFCSYVPDPRVPISWNL